VNVRTNEDFLANDREQADVLQQWEIPQTELRIGAEPAEALSDWRTALGFWRQAPPLHEKRREIRLAELTAWEARQRECLARDPPKAGDLPRYLNKIAKQVLSTRQGIQADCFSGLVRDHTSIARTAWLAGDWPACRDALLQALACRAERDANSADKSGISYAAVQTYDCLAEACAMLTGNRQQATEYYHQARAKDPDGKGKGLDPSRLPDWWPDADQQAKPASSGAAQNQPPTDGTIAVPKVTGMIAEAARAAIEQAGLEARPELGDPAPPDRQETEVYEQRPSLGTPCRKGSPVYFKFFARRGE
jgi:hypothetical protein